MKVLKLSLTSLFCKTDVQQNFQTIWCSDLQEAKCLLEKVYMLDGWNVEQPLEVKWNSKRFDYLYSFRVSKNLDDRSSKKKNDLSLLSIKASTSSARQHSEFRLGTLISP